MTSDVTTQIPSAAVDAPEAAPLQESSTFTISRNQGELLIAAQGNLVASSVAGQRDLLLKVLETPEPKVILNLGTTEQIDSLGITLILGLYKSCAKSKSAFVVEGVTPAMMRVFRLFNLPKLFPVTER